MRLLVPVQLDVLMVRSQGGKWADCRMQPPKPGGSAAEDLLPRPFSDLPEPRPRGAYLHWALPDALTRGEESEPANSDTPGSMCFPAVPDRWLVVRVYPGPLAYRRAVRAWVLRAGDEVASAVPLDRWVEEPAPRGRIINPLTALGFGDPAWAATYDNVVNRFSFYDALADVTSGPLAYLVCGFFADDRLDPLGDPGLRAQADLEAKLTKMRWHLGDATAERPRRTLYHGAAVGLGWPQAGFAGADLDAGEVSGPPPATGLEVVIGRTGAEAFGALAARVRGNPALARLVETFQLGMLKELERPDGRQRIDARLHAAAFRSFSAGEITERVWEPGAPPGPPSRPTRPPIVDRPPFATMMHEAPNAVRGDSKLHFAGERAQLADVLSAVTPKPQPPAPGEGRWIEVKRALPRYFLATEPVVLVKGARRGYRHGGDGRFSVEGTLACRTSGAAVTELSARGGANARIAIRGEDLMSGGLGNPYLPPECDELLRELLVLDPGSASAAEAVARRRPGVVEDGTLRRFMVEQTAWWALRDARVDPRALLTESGIAGELPSPLAVTPPVRPWSPLFLEWQAELTPAAPEAFALQDLDLAPRTSDPANASSPLQLEGRVLLTAGVPTTLASAARASFMRATTPGTTTELPPDHRPRLASDLALVLLDTLAELPVPDGSADIAEFLAQLDVVGGSLQGLQRGMRGGVSATEPASPSDSDGLPTPFFPVRAGFLRFRRLRLVDGFGQIVELPLPIADATPSPVVVAEPIAIPGRPGVAVLVPRLTARSRILLRFMAADGSDEEANPETSPVCGFVMPNHLDSSLQFFAADGDELGGLRDGGDPALGWENAPGRPTLVGQTPATAIANPFLGGIAEGLYRWGLSEGDSPDPVPETALAAVLRVIDTALWAVDPYAGQGEEHLPLLLGHPVAVVRARLRLEVDDPLGAAALPDGTFAVRLGALGRWDDGVLGYFAGDDYRVFHVPHPAAAAFARPLGPGRGFLQRADLVAAFFNNFSADVSGSEGSTPVRHPAIDTSGVVHVRAGEDIALTLLLEPHAVVTVTTGILPRKDLALKRDWLAPGLARLAPTFRFGPVLVDPQTLRMPVPHEAGASWSWDHRSDVVTWAREPVIHAAGDAVLPGAPARASEGWLRYTPAPPGAGATSGGPRATKRGSSR